MVTDVSASEYCRYIPITPARTLLALKQRQARGARAMQRMFRARRWYDWTQAAICIQAHTRRFEAQLLLGRLRSAALEHELKRREQVRSQVQRDCTVVHCIPVCPPKLCNRYIPSALLYDTPACSVLKLMKMPW